MEKPRGLRFRNASISLWCRGTRGKGFLLKKHDAPYAGGWYAAMTVGVTVRAPALRRADMTASR
ncbi:MAG: hypothetical protein RLY87_934 [Chloroflexota bacterium]